MSMRNYAFQEYGILLNDLVDENLLEELAEDEVVERQFSLTGGAFALRDDGTEDWGDCTYFNDAPVFYLSLPRHPQFFKAAYRDMDDLVRSVARVYWQARREDGRLPKLKLPDIRKRIRSISGTYLG